jgi:uncharacterized protein YcbX
MTDTSMHVRSLHRYPVKGLSAEPLAQVTLAAGRSIPHDRRFALARAATEFNPARPEWLLKTNFFMLMRDEKLAQLRTRFDETSGILTIEHDGRTLLAARIVETSGRRELEAFFAGFLAECPGGPPRLLEAPGHTFSDAKQKPNATTYHYVSLVNVASVAKLERAAGAPVDPLRFRANVYFDGAAAWSELGWSDTEVTLGSARLRVLAPITRCAATAVNPASAVRDLDIPRLLQQQFAHVCMGVYAEVVTDGTVAPGDRLARV